MSGNSFDFNDAPNPYAAGEPSEFGNPSAGVPDKRGMVGHVPVVGILLIVQGVLQLLMGAYLLALPFFLSEFLDEQLQNNPALQQQQDFTPEQMKQIMLGTYLVMGAIGGVLSLVQIAGGIQTLRFRTRVFDIVALSAGGLLSPVAGCWCFPTALMLTIYGLIVLFNEPVKAAFNLVSSGQSPAEVKSLFANLPK